MIARDSALAAHRLGRRAERRAMWYFRLRAWRILARNWRPRAAARGGSELDLVVCRGRVLVFVEVKARSAQADVETLLSFKQRRRIERAAQEFVSLHGLEDKTWRFDLVCVLGRRLSHTRDAWRAGE